MFKSKKESLTLLYDIGTGSVGAALARFPEGKNPEILKTARKPIKFYGSPSSIRIELSMINAIEAVSSDLQKFLKTKDAEIEDIYCVLSSLWHISQTKIIKIEEKEPIAVTKELVKKSVESEEKYFRAMSARNYSAGDAEGLQIVEKDITQIKLNGYETIKPYGKIVKFVEIVLFLSAASKNTADDIINAISRFFHVEDVKFQTFSHISASSLMDIHSGLRDFIFMDISGEMTDIAIIKDDILVEALSFPFGKNNIVREVAEKLRSNEADALSKIIIHKSGAFDSKTDSIISAVIFGSMKKWQEMFKNIFFKASGTISMPKKIFFMSDEDVENLMADFIKSYRIDETENLGDMVNVEFINNDFLKGYVDYMVAVKRDPFLSIETIFLNKLKTSVQKT